ncbi:MAG: excinuclease ABC subunit UvrC, partial [Lachnospiraceae bacterium]
MFDIQEELKKLPGKPGVYIMHDDKDAIIYVGKAISLKNRVRQYFQSSRNKGPKIEKMVTHIRRFEYIITDSELEALVLECNLIKEHRPKYNTMLKDDKTYPYIKVTLGETYPRVLFSRQMKKDKSRYFGPYTSAGAVKDTIELIQKLYHLRTCSRSLPKDIGKERPCLNYHIHQCKAPCQGYVTPEEYQRQIRQALDFLNGKYQPVIEELESKMQQASEEMEFERAIEYRELLNSVRAVAQKQKITDSDGEDRDVIALAMDEQDAVVQMFFVRDGKLIGREHYHVTIANEDTEREVLTSFIKQYYAGTPYLPKELMLPVELEEQDIIEKGLSRKKGHRVYLNVA